MAFWVPLLRPVLCCSGVSRALFVRPSLCGSVASASAAAAAGCSDRFGFTSRDGSVAAPGGAESLGRFLRGVSAAACPVPASGSGACSRVRWWCRFRLRLRLWFWRLSRVRWWLWFRLRLRCWFRLRVSVPVSGVGCGLPCSGFRLRVSVPASVLAVVPALASVLAFVPGAVLAVAPVPVPAAGAKRPGRFPAPALWASLISPGLCNQCPRAESCCM